VNVLHFRQSSFYRRCRAANIRCSTRIALFSSRGFSVCSRIRRGAWVTGRGNTREPARCMTRVRMLTHGGSVWGAEPRLGATIGARDQMRLFAPWFLAPRRTQPHSVLRPAEKTVVFSTMRMHLRLSPQYRRCECLSDIDHGVFDRSVLETQRRCFFQRHDLGSTRLFLRSRLLTLLGLVALFFNAGEFFLAFLEC
jgi:hypothetical protein